MAILTNSLIPCNGRFGALLLLLTAYFAQNYAQDYPEPEAIVTALGQGMRVCEVPVRMNERQGGVSSIRALKSLHYMIKVSLAILLDSFRLGSRKEKKA